MSSEQVVNAVSSDEIGLELEGKFPQFKVEITHEIVKEYEKAFPYFHKMAFQQNITSPIAVYKIKEEKPNSEEKVPTSNFDIPLDEFISDFKVLNDFSVGAVKKSAKWPGKFKNGYIRIVELDAIKFDGGNTIKIKVDEVLEKGYIYRFNTFIHLILCQGINAVISPDTLAAPIYGIDSDDQCAVFLYAIGNGKKIDELSFTIRYFVTDKRSKLETAAIINDIETNKPLKVTGAKHVNKGMYKITESNEFLRHGKEKNGFSRGIRMEESSPDGICVLIPRKRNARQSIFGTPGIMTKKGCTKPIRSTYTTNTTPAFNFFSVKGEVCVSEPIKKLSSTLTIVSKCGMNSHFDDGVKYNEVLALLKSAKKETNKRIKEQQALEGGPATKKSKDNRGKEIFSAVREVNIGLGGSKLVGVYDKVEVF